LPAARERIAAQLGERGVSVSFASVDGDPVRVLVQHAEPDTLLVMGAYGHSRLYHVTLGSITERVIRDAHGPVLLASKGVGTMVHAWWTHCDSTDPDGKEAQKTHADN
jgi:nucleotide-binding universal stress UspA family protein